MPHWYGFALVFLGAGLGGMLRHGVNLGSLRLLGPDPLVGTFFINVLGSLAIGGIAGYLATRGHASQPLQLLLITGILGGFTTFSAFSLEAALLWQRGQLASFTLYVIGSVVLSIGGVFGGLALARSIH
jgi:CrcB protein